MRYTRNIRRGLYEAPSYVLDQLRNDFQDMEFQMENGIAWEDVKRKMIMRMWLGDMCEWKYWGGTKVVQLDKDKEKPERDTSWFARIRKAYEHTTDKTNRTIFGRRYFRKNTYPLSFVFYERGNATEGKHIHTIHHFPPAIARKAEQYLNCFSTYWCNHPVNKPVGRVFWYEDVVNQDKVIRYATKRMTNNYEFGWFPVG
jgi:hypothetical protein